MTDVRVTYVRLNRKTVVDAYKNALLTLERTNRVRHMTARGTARTDATRPQRGAVHPAPEDVAGVVGSGDDPPSPDDVAAPIANRWPTESAEDANRATCGPGGDPPPPPARLAGDTRDAATRDAVDQSAPRDARRRRGGPRPRRRRAVAVPSPSAARRCRRSGSALLLWRTVSPRLCVPASSRPVVIPGALLLCSEIVRLLAAV